MSENIHEWDDYSPENDVSDVDLGDERRTKRYISIVEALSHRPDASVPEAIEDEADQQGYYRFIRNPSIAYEDLLEPHYEATRQRAERLDTVLCIHDTTEFAFPVHDDEMRDDLARLSSNRQGYQWHSSLVCSADHTRAPLGLAHTQPFVHLNNLEHEDDREFWDERGGTYPDNEKWRWIEGVERADGRLQEVDQVIHVMDREADDYQLLFAMDVCDYDSIVRMTHPDRRVSVGELRSDHEPLARALTDQPWMSSRTVELSPRSNDASNGSHPVRRAREATLKVRAADVSLRRPDHVRADAAADCLDVHVVEVLEVNPPAGEEPVHWLLVTTEPIDSSKDVWEIVDHYRARWTTEEYDKSIKTGTDYTSLQHRSAKTLLAALAPSAIVAHQLLVLRYLDRQGDELPARVVVTSVQLTVLQTEKPNDVPDEQPTVEDVMQGVASLGGHISSNGPPGWQVLGRGWQRLVEYTYGFRLAKRAQEK